MDSSLPPPPPPSHTDPQSYGTPPPTADLPVIPWEDRSRPVVDALIDTFKLFITDPGAAFRRMPTSGDLGRPIVYLIILGWIGTLFGQLYSIAFGGLQLPFAEDFGDLGATGLSLGFNIAIIAFAPVIILIAAGIHTVILHLMLLLLGAAKGGFDTTLRVVCYSATPQPLQIVPFCGGFIAGLWALVLVVIGLATAHQTTWVKALIAVLLPLVLCCVCVVVGVAMAGGIGALVAAQQ